MKKRLFLLCTALSLLCLTGCGQEPQSVSCPAGNTAISETVSQETTQVDQLLQVNGILYYNTDTESTIEGRCGTLDGKITSSVAENAIPTEDDQSNFGIGAGYQYASEGTVEVSLNGHWWIFAQRP